MSPNLKLDDALDLSSIGVAYAQWSDGEFVALKGASGTLFWVGRPSQIDLGGVVREEDLHESYRGKFRSRTWRAYRPSAPLTKLAEAADEA